jgi:hypothetical protein
VAYLFARNWGVEAGYGFNRYSIDVDRSDWHGSMTYKFSGPTLALVAQF